MDHPHLSTAETPPPAYDPVLGGVLGFTHPDLLANHAGRMTDAQRVGLRQGSPRLVREDVLMAGGFGLFFLIGLIAILPGGALVPCVGGTVILGLLTALAAGLAVRKWIAIRSDVDDGAVMALEGPARHRAVGGMVGRYGAVYQLVIQETRFELPKDTLSIFREDATYRIYYAPRSKIILSAEPLQAKRGV